MRLALALVIAAAGCAAETVPAPSAAPGMKRWSEAGASRHHLSGKARPRRGALPSAASRSLSRPAIAHRWTLLTATAYCYTGSRNAAGDWPHAGTVAANGYPLGTRLLVRGYGVFTVEDRSAPGATELDIYMGDSPDCAARAAAFGRRLLHVSEVAA